MVNETGLFRIISVFISYLLVQRHKMCTSNNYFLIVLAVPNLRKPIVFGQHNIHYQNMACSKREHRKYFKENSHWTYF